MVTASATCLASRVCTLRQPLLDGDGVCELAGRSAWFKNYSHGSTEQKE